MDIIPKPEIAECKKCGQLIHFITMKNGKKMPCENKLLITINFKGEVLIGYESHFTYCPQVTAQNMKAFWNEK